jgi:hypothetical protein
MGWEMVLEDLNTLRILWELGYRAGTPNVQGS